MNKSLETSLSSSQGGIKNSGLLANSNCRLEMLLILCVLLTLQKCKEYYLASTILATENWNSKSREVFQTIDQILSAAQTLQALTFKNFFLSNQWISFQFLKTNLNISTNLICSGSKGSSELFRGVGWVLAFISSDFLIGLWIIMMRCFNDFFCLLFWALKKRELGVRQNNAGFV